MPVRARGGGGYETTPCPREIVPGQLLIHSATWGMIGDWTACMRADSRMRSMGLKQVTGADEGMVEIGADVLQANHIDKPLSLHGEKRLGMEFTDNDLAA